MNTSGYHPLMHNTRGETVESIHFGAIAVVDQDGKLLASYGDPHIKTYLRSSAKPFQALPFIEAGGQQHFNLDQAEIALICASHSGTDEHVEIVESFQQKCGLTETNLQCGIHPPLHSPTAERLKANDLAPTPNRHNCSGKHSGMLAFAQMLNFSLENYLDSEHPVQEKILQAVIDMCELRPEQIDVGIDGCSAPNFAMPLFNAAFGFARLINPIGLTQERATACTTITEAMRHHPEIVAGPARFDTDLMVAMKGKIVAKGGAEGYQGIGVAPNAYGNGTPALGIAIKISDGDHRNQIRAAVAIEVLDQLGILSFEEREGLTNFGPQLPVYNWRKILVGQKRPVFKLDWE